VKSFLFPMAAAICLVSVGLAAPPANAKGCIKGALVGGVAGHFAHHGILGAAAGCVVGHHMANKHAHEQSYQGYGSSQPSPDTGR
jgi:outer membrane lipoprotein SlyB